MVPSARKAALRMGLTECIGGRFARACSLSGIRMGFVLVESLLAATGSGFGQSHGRGDPGQPCHACSGYERGRPDSSSSFTIGLASLGCHAW